MPGERVFMRGVACLCALQFMLAAPALAGAADGDSKEQAQRQATQPLNNAPVWRDVRGGDVNRYQTTQVRGVETNVLVQSEGEIWRQIRNGPITVYGGWLLIAICAIIAGIYYGKGAIKLHEKPSGRMVERFNSFERIAHWTMGISFCVLGVTGLIILFGRYLVIPVLGYTVFSWLAILSKNVHNFVAPVFVVSLLVFIVIYVKDNLPEKGDLAWLAKGWRMFAGEHMPSGRFNAGEKVWFWLGVVALCLVVSATGLILLFPNFEQGRLLMQQANVIHAIAGVLVIGFSLGHIYMGTIGVEGAYENMRIGYTDEAWAREHHEYWYNEVMAGKGVAGGSAPSTAKAVSVKEGWKL
ncbi:MAG: formate dehydrogenase subunit gamma [Betaproteobacteria bacterium]|nr:formate dehydrogenase subunit gamma [Betaproteobacteria bacterium]